MAARKGRKERVQRRRARNMVDDRVFRAVDALVLIAVLVEYQIVSCGE
jgi:hypothetical protein